MSGEVKGKKVERQKRRVVQLGKEAVTRRITDHEGITRGNELYASHSLDLAPGGDEWDAEVQEVNRRVRLPMKE